MSNSNILLLIAVVGIGFFAKDYFGGSGADEGMRGRKYETEHRFRLGSDEKTKLGLYFYDDKRMDLLRKGVRVGDTISCKKDGDFIKGKNKVVEVSLTLQKNGDLRGTVSGQRMTFSQLNKGKQ